MVSDNTANGLNLRCLPIHLWTHAHDATEEAGEIVRVVNAELVAYLITFLVFLRKPLRRKEKSIDEVDIVDRAVSRALLEYYRETRLRVACIVGKVL